MPEPATIAAGVMIGKAVLDTQFGFSAASKARKNARKQAKLILKQGAEELRRFDRSRGQVEGGGRASLYGSNLQNTGSSQMYLQSLSEELQRQRNFMDDDIKQRARLAKKGGGYIASQAKWGAIGSGVGAASQGIGLFNFKPKVDTSGYGGGWGGSGSSGGQLSGTAGQQVA